MMRGTPLSGLLGAIVFGVAAGAAVLAALHTPARKPTPAPALARAHRHAHESAHGSAHKSAPISPPGLDEIRRVAPDVDRPTLADALRAVACARASRPPEPGSSKDSILAVIDYSLPSTERRLWVFDLAKPALLFQELVAHGSGTGENLALAFSNEPGSKASSLGLYRAAEVYQGHNGYSLRLDGLTPGYNDRARERDIVMHGAWYVSPKHARTFGRLGRSWGCPALDPEVAKPVIDALRDGAWVYISAKKLEREKGAVVGAVCGDRK
jgi:hypothetical protein